MANEKRLIDANALLNLLRPLAAYSKILQKILRIIETCPTVDAMEVIHGRWIELGSDDTDDLRWMCSNCNEVRFEYPGRNNYCPNCGAKMDRGEKV